MSEKPEPDAAIKPDAEIDLPRPRRVWLRRAWWTLLCLSLALTLLGFAAWRWLKSEAFNQYVAGQIETSAKDYGLNVKVGGFGWSWDERVAKLRDLVVTNAQGQPVADIKAAQLELEILEPYTRREAILRKLTLDGLTLHAELALASAGAT